MRWWRPLVTLSGAILLFGTPIKGQVIPLEQRSFNEQVLGLPGNRSFHLEGWYEKQMARSIFALGISTSN
ncbi:MAG: hypothetical protein CM1200mP14_28160 [Gammaproteobacteria bacterium]|nr:MAG: hypothetical protein CM1200mP14_28160 [Gammaproteobacteria bacterium]